DSGEYVIECKESRGGVVTVFMGRHVTDEKARRAGLGADVKEHSRYAEQKLGIRPAPGEHFGYWRGSRAFGRVVRHTDYPHEEYHERDEHTKCKVGDVYPGLICRTGKDQPARDERRSSIADATERLDEIQPDVSSFRTSQQRRVRVGRHVDHRYAGGYRKYSRQHQHIRCEIIGGNKQKAPSQADEHGSYDTAPITPPFDGSGNRNWPNNVYNIETHLYKCGA